MALPTAMTIFNRSMINLDNEIGRLSSFDLNRKVIKKLKSNVKFFNLGNIKYSNVHADDFFKDYEITYNIDTDLVEYKSKFSILITDENKMEISILTLMMI